MPFTIRIQATTVRIPLFFVILVLTPVIGLSQEFGNIIANFDGEKMVITYDLIYDNPDEKFRITAFSSHNNYSAPLSNVSNDVGSNITPGRGKRITWYLKTELPVNFNDNIQIKLVAEFMEAPKPEEPTKEIQPIEFIYPLAGNKARTGKSMRIRWVGGDPDATYRLELFEGNVKKLELNTFQNKYQYIWPVPKDHKKGKNYSLRLINTANTGDVMQSPAFQIKGKSPAALIAVPVTIAGAGVIYWLTREKTEEELPPPYGPDEF